MNTNVPTNSHNHVHVKRSTNTSTNIHTTANTNANTDAKTNNTVSIHSPTDTDHSNTLMEERIIKYY